MPDFKKVALSEYTTDTTSDLWPVIRSKTSMPVALHGTTPATPVVGQVRSVPLIRTKPQKTHMIDLSSLL